MKKSSIARAMSAKVRVTRRRRTVWDQKIHENGGLMGFNQQKLWFNQQKLWLWDFLWDNMDHWDWTNKELGVMDNLMIFEDVWEMVLDSVRHVPSGNDCYVAFENGDL